mmetsp:Transcript_40463/g.88470  ORF Transcript_40463/g.88470 Transcript_40463/m.88470 type:complete len:231 (+) Transcript_40463:303-995(+)
MLKPPRMMRRSASQTTASGAPLLSTAFRGDNVFRRGTVSDVIRPRRSLGHDRPWGRGSIAASHSDRLTGRPGRTSNVALSSKAAVIVNDQRHKARDHASQNTNQAMESQKRSHWIMRTMSSVQRITTCTKASMRPICFSRSVRSKPWFWLCAAMLAVLASTASGSTGRNKCPNGWSNVPATVTWPKETLTSPRRVALSCFKGKQSSERELRPKANNGTAMAPSRVGSQSS